MNFAEEQSYRETLKKLVIPNLEPVVLLNNTEKNDTNAIDTVTSQ